MRMHVVGIMCLPHEQASEQIVPVDLFKRHLWRHYLIISQVFHALTAWAPSQAFRLTILLKTGRTEHGEYDADAFFSPCMQA